ncbi:MAG: efflux RND transporter periplasmic adaptor subunit [Gemmatimonadota bacterium]|nr:efflux RND transporter periplasmic adaptor subunit [Gemmatimonadota bacterium]
MAAIAALGVSACGGKAAPPGGFKMPPAEVGVVTVTPHPVGVPYAFPGQVEAYRSVEVRSRVEGVIDARPFTEGSLVRRGQLLYQLDSVRYAAAYAGALATYDNAARTLTRLQALLPRHAVAQQDVDNAQTAVESAKAALDQARKDLSDTQIRAEIDGRVGRTRLQVGGRVTGPGDLLTTIDQLDPVYVTFRPSSEQVAAWQSRAGDRALITPGSKLAVRVVRPDGSVFPVTGRLDFVSPMLDSATGTQEFRARFANANGALVPGAFVQVRLDGFENAHALTVPQRAVQQGLGRQFVYVVGAGDSVSMRDVQPGVWTGSAWVIDSGLVAGDRVIVDGVQKVGPGMVVKPVPATDSAGAAPMAASAGGARQP